MSVKRDRIQAVLDQTSREVALLGAVEKKAVFRLIKEAEDELSGELVRFLSGVDPKEVFTARKNAELLRQLKTVRIKLVALAPAAASSLDLTRKTAGALAVDHVKFEVETLADAFTKSATPVNLDVARVLSRGDRLLLARHQRAAVKYSRQTREWLSRQLGVGVLKRESFDQLTARLVRLGRLPAREFAERGPLAARGLLTQPRHAINRLVRTEAINAYNTYHLESIQELDMMKRWDSSLDRRGCLICRDLDGEVRKNDVPFSGGFQHPPAHPFCRCTVVPWDPNWDHPSLPSEGTEQIEPPTAAP